MAVYDLNKGWQLLEQGLECGPEMHASVWRKTEGWMAADLPCDIHTPLIEQGIIREPLQALNCYDCVWTEDRSWWFRRNFVADSTLLARDVAELCLDGLDAEADIFLNGLHLGHHGSSFYPFRRDIRDLLVHGDNSLLVRVTSGLEYYSRQDLAGISGRVGVEGIFNRGDERRALVRKPQYVYGWDWGPRVASCGIAGGAWLEAYDTLAVRSVYVHTVSADRHKAVLHVEAELENLRPVATLEAELQLRVEFRGRSMLETGQETSLRSGLNYLDFDIVIDEPHLWWPNGMGEQPLYNVCVSARAGDVLCEYAPLEIGIRTIELDQQATGDDKRRFAFKVNGTTVFSKGANWIPADSIYVRIPDSKYESLINEAADANFNMLRIWGGGIYEREIFYRQCDRMGILVWQDFMFSCAVYPDNQERFRREVTCEMDYQTRRLRNHPSLCLWTGNNECQMIYGGNAAGETSAFSGVEFYNITAPRTIRRNCPHIPYWNSSPYGGGFANSNDMGDKHHWDECTMNSLMENRITPERYDEITAGFVSEYGYIGPCIKSSIAKYHGDQVVDRNSAVWTLHNNRYEKATVVAGINKHYINPDNLSLEDYLLYAGLCQGLMYGYSLESLRFKGDCSGALFWMYNDCWGEVGWSIIDYYLQRKPAFYYVKRAFSPLKMIMRAERDDIVTVACNDTPDSIILPLEYGYTGFDGSAGEASVVQVEIGPYSRAEVLRFGKGNQDTRHGCYYVKPQGVDDRCQPATLRSHPFRDLEMPAASLVVDDIRIRPGKAEFYVAGSVYAHAVHFGLGEGFLPSDEYFDLLPGERRKIEIMMDCESCFAMDIKARCLNNLL